MLNERIDRLDFALAGAVHVRFDASDGELFAIAHIVAAIVDERFRGVALDGDAVLELRELVALHDTALERARDGFNGGTLVMSVARLGLLARAIADWQQRCDRVGFLRAADAATAPLVDALREGLLDLHARAARVAVGDDELAQAA